MLTVYEIMLERIEYGLFEKVDHFQLFIRTASHPTHFSTHRTILTRIDSPENTALVRAQFLFLPLIGCFVVSV